MLADLQAAFGRALLEGEAGAVAAALVSDRIAADRRFGIHVNTVFSLLGDGLEAAFPVVCRLVGAPFFRMAAHAFIARHPPTVPQLAVYGRDFADFLAQFPPAASVPYLPCVARLEWARVEAYFAADAAPLAPARLQDVSADAYPTLIFILHPTVRLVRSRWPVFTLWQAHQHEAPTPVDLSAPGEAALIHRPDALVEIIALSAGDAALLAATAQGASLGHAAGAAFDAEPDFDLQAALARNLGRGIFEGFTLPTPR